MRKRLPVYFIFAFCNIFLFSNAQNVGDVEKLKSIAEESKKAYIKERAEAEKIAVQKGWPIRAEVNGSLIEVQHLNERGIPQYFKTDNNNAAATISTNKVYTGGGAGLSLSGAGISVREWDGGSVLSTHQEFGSRVTVVDAVATHYHSTHVAGTIMASGVVANAKGMAFAATLRSFDWNSDVSEMASEGAAGALISNHSYGYIRGWYSGTWYGDPAISTQEDYLFGFYDSYTQQWDQIAYNAPNFLICKSAGNDRGDSGSGYPADGPYDCIGQQGVAKNILTVGAVDDIPGGYTTPSGVTQTNTYFSSWGPADDGRIKPDIVANGYSLYSTYNTNNTSYASLSGTSMATPSAAGSLALLQQHRYALTGTYLKAATLKALVIHTADEAGANAGPDYNFGWGLMNTKNAALKISSDQTVDVISELSLNNGASYTRNIIASGTEPIKVTIVWTDPAGTPPAASLDPITPMLVNDLDLRLSYSTNTYYPWKLDRNNPAVAATNASENNVDNVEVVYISNPVAGATYTITVDHDGTLTGGSQAFSVIISGILATVAPVADFTASSVTPSVNSQVNFTDISSNVPTSWAWSFSPSTVTYLNGTTSTSQNPQVSFNAAGNYTVTLTATNAYGSDVETKASYINAINCTVNTFPWNEGFENAGVIPSCWSQEAVTGTLNWTFRAGSGSSNPASAHTGSYNANFYEGSYGTNNVKKLVTPTLNLATLSSPQLKFWHTQPYWSPDQDELRVYYKTSAAGSWNLLATYTSSITAWTEETINLPAQSGDYYLAFEGTEKYGYGICLDDVSVTSQCVTTYPVSVSISASSNPVCAGTSSTFTAVAVNGGVSPSYQWKVNNINVGTNSATYSYNPANGDIVSCVLTSNLACSTGSPATSNSITMTVNPTVTASVSISASTNPVCAGTSVNYTAVPVNGGTTPTYQWKVNGSNVGINSAAYSYIPSHNDVVTCVLTSNANCVSGSPATSNSITMTVNPTVTASVSISASTNPVCAGTSVNYTAVPVNGGTTPAYQWKVNGSNVGINSAAYSYIPSHNDVVTCVLTSNANCVSGSPATSNSITMTVNPTVTASVSISASTNPVCAGTSVNYTAVPVNGGTTPAYQWKVNGSNVGINSAAYSYIPSHNDVVTCVLTSNANCVNGSPATSNSITMTVNPTVTASVSISASTNPVCSGTSVNYTAVPVNGGTTPAYQWKVNGSNVGINSAAYSYIPSNNDVVTCVLTSNANCVSGSPTTSNSINMTVNPTVTASVSISASLNSVCAGTSVEYTAVPVNGGNNPVYQWKVNGLNAGTNTAVFSYVPSHNDQISCELTSDALCVTGNPAVSNIVTMIVNPVLTAGVSILASLNSVCAGTSVEYTAVPVNGGNNPVYQWKVNGLNAGTNSAVFSYVPSHYDQLSCELTSDALCVTGNPAVSNIVTMIVNPVLTAGVSISASLNSVCAGTSVEYTAVPVNGGNNPVYQWKVNGLNAGTNSAVFSFVPSHNDQVSCELTSDALCVTGNPAVSNIVTMIVNPVLTAGVSISASLNSVCLGTTVEYTAVPVNGGNNPVYQWKVNGLNAGTNTAVFSYVPSHNDQVSCELTSDALCLTGNPAVSNIVTMIVNPVLTAGVSISASLNSVCAGTSVEFTAVPVNGGNNPVYQWKVNGLNAGTNSAVFSYVPSHNDQVSCELTSDALCVMGNPAVSNLVLMEVNPLLMVEVSVTASENPVLAGTEVTFTATADNGGSNPVFQWKVNNVNVGVNASTYSYVPQDGDQVVCELTSDVLCSSGNPASSTPVIMGVTPLQLQVTPLVQNVGSAAGIFDYSVQCNTAWTVTSDQSWCTVTFSGSGNGIITASYPANTSGAARSATITVTVTGISPVSVVLNQEAEVSKQLTLTLLLEGLYNGTILNKAQNTGGSQFSGNIADHITIELHESAAPYAMIGGPYDSAIMTDGTAEIQIPLTLSSSYYLVVKHRNSLETWSSAPVSFSGTAISYDFSSSSSQAMGNNMKSKFGKYVLYTGDINQDGLIDQLDMLQLNTDAEGFISGYTNSDLNGDGLIDADDMILLDNNAAVAIQVIRP